MNNAQAQVQNQTGVVEQLKRQVMDLQAKQRQTQQALANIENVLRNAQHRQRTAEANVKATNDKLVVHRQNIHQTEGLVSRGPNRPCGLPAWDRHRP